MVNKHFNVFFIPINYYFDMFNVSNIVVLVKSFKTAIYMPKTEVGWALTANWSFYWQNRSAVLVRFFFPATKFSSWFLRRWEASKREIRSLWWRGNPPMIHTHTYIRNMYISRQLRGSLSLRWRDTLLATLERTARLLKQLKLLNAPAVKDSWSV